jgi:hypothetical protein
MTDQEKIELAQFFSNLSLILKVDSTDKQKLDLIIEELAKLDYSIDTILIQLLANKNRLRKKQLHDCNYLLNTSLHFIDSKHRGRNYKYYYNLLIDKCRKFFKKNHPELICDHRKFEEE